MIPDAQVLELILGIVSEASVARNYTIDPTSYLENPIMKSRVTNILIHTEYN